MSRRWFYCHEQPAPIDEMYAVSALYFYPKEVGDRAIELGLTTREEMNRRKIFALILLILGDFLIPYIMVPVSLLFAFIFAVLCMGLVGIW